MRGFIDAEKLSARPLKDGAKTNNNKMKTLTSHEIALTFAEKFQSEYPNIPIYKLMEELRISIEEYGKQQVKSVDLADVVCWADMTEETPNLGDLILVRFPPEQRTRPVIIEFDELFEWIDGTQYIRL